MGRYPYAGTWRGPGPEDGAAVDRAMDMAGIRDLALRPHQQLSGGEQQLVQLARALAQSPSVLLMDEPAANLDVKHQRDLGGRIRALASTGMAILLSTHDMNAVLRWCDRAVLLSAGSIVTQGTPAEVLTPDRVLKVFGAEPNIATSTDGKSFLAF
jgi:iron complex transport system ATP-binding protein